LLRAQGATITVLYDASATSSTLAFKVKDGAVTDAISGYPTGAAMRPWVSLLYATDQVTVSGWRNA
jgi:hypothetical protein